MKCKMMRRAAWRRAAPLIPFIAMASLRLTGLAVFVIALRRLGESVPEWAVAAAYVWLVWILKTAVKLAVLALLGRWLHNRSVRRGQADA